jgi:hypothetical protein
VKKDSFLKAAGFTAAAKWADLRFPTVLRVGGQVLSARARLEEERDAGLGRFVEPLNFGGDVNLEIAWPGGLRGLGEA